MTKLLDHSVMAAVPVEAPAPNVPELGLTGSRVVALHFTLAAEDVAGCGASIRRLSGVEPGSESWRIICLDTPDHAIAKLGLGFGVRRRDGAKRSGWRRFVAPLSAATPRSARRKLSRCLRHADAVQVVARGETQRSCWCFTCGDVPVEASLDLTSFVVNGKDIVLASADLVCEAANANFFELVTKLSSCRLRLGAESDLTRTYREADGLVSPHVTAFAPKLDQDMSAAEAFRTVAAACFDHFLLNETAIRTRDDREAVHQCRVALRRLTACLRFFSRFLGGADYEALRGDLKDLGHCLRDARDLDVMMQDVIGPALTEDPPAGATELMHAIEARRDKAHAKLVATLRADSSTALYLRFALWLEAGDWTRPADPKTMKQADSPIPEFACKKFGRMCSSFDERCAKLGEMDREARHKTRIRAKYLRYDAEFFAALAASKTARKRLADFTQGVKKIQTVLGDWNDLLMARQFLISFAQDLEQGVQGHAQSDADAKRDNAAASAGRALAERIAAGSEAEFRDKSLKACAVFSKLKPFWPKLG